MCVTAPPTNTDVPPAEAAAQRLEGAPGGGFRATPTVFVNGEWFPGPLEAEAIWAAGAALASP